MEEDGAAVLKLVEAATEVLARADADEASTSICEADTAALNQLLGELRRLIAELGLRRVLDLSGTQMVNAGVELYNAPRAALRALAQTEKTDMQGAHQLATFPRYSLALTRFVAAKIMGLSLVCSKDGVGQENGNKKNIQFVDECVDVLRSFGRVGMLMLESASIDCEKCEEYLALANEAFSSSLQLWSRIGLSCLTKFKRGLELEHVVDDLWDFCVDRVRVHQLLGERSDNTGGLQGILSSLQELKMLVPYKTSYASSLLELMRKVSDGCAKAAQHEQQVAFAEEAIRIGDALGSNADESLPDLITSFKQHILVNMLQALCAMDDLERADTCYQLIPANRSPEVLLLMIRLYVSNQQFENAHHLLLVLFQQESLYDSLVGARIYADGLSYSATGNRIYHVLNDNYEDADFVINLEMACNFASLEDKRCEAMDEFKRIGPALLAMQRCVLNVSLKLIRLDHG
ncbi:Tetratricopeptide-like helical [Phytophthora cinnamomi]|uniref:Tetratricopeptide-like helical n=1 Tax=Phytophthora cinnamomi TaxID=4785 RepID=UPI0035597578|nr:Tetratricopeptide-like helical [Phytophthora cinnamomi]